MSGVISYCTVTADGRVGCGRATVTLGGVVCGLNVAGPRDDVGGGIVLPLRCSFGGATFTLGDVVFGLNVASPCHDVSVGVVLPLRCTFGAAAGAGEAALAFAATGTVPGFATGAGAGGAGCGLEQKLQVFWHSHATVTWRGAFFVILERGKPQDVSKATCAHVKPFCARWPSASSLQVGGPLTLANEWLPSATLRRTFDSS